jgi:Nuclear protein 96
VLIVYLESLLHSCCQHRAIHTDYIVGLFVTCEQCAVCTLLVQLACVYVQCVFYLYSWHLQGVCFTVCCTACVLQCAVCVLLVQAPVGRMYLTVCSVFYLNSWHVYCVLSSLGYGDTLSEHKAALVCVHYAAQLKSAGLWHWAVFVLLHLKSRVRLVGKCYW